MPGRVLREGFVGLDEPDRVATYEDRSQRREAGDSRDETATATPANPADEALLEHLKSLGYLSGTSSKGDRNLAAIAFENRDYRKAAQMYQALVAAEPDDSALRASFAGALGALGRYDEAIVQLDRSLAIDALNPEAHHNRGAALERLGRQNEAIADYREAVRYRGDYAAVAAGPGAAGCSRTTTRAPPTEVERRAVTFAEEASNWRRRGDYTDALARLDDAKRLAPRLRARLPVRIERRLSRRRSPRAIRALERCLVLEPDNALFRTNLTRLRSQR